MSDNNHFKNKDRSHHWGYGHHYRSKEKSYGHHGQSPTSSSSSSYQCTSSTRNQYPQKRSNDDHRHNNDSTRKKYDKRSRSRSRSRDNNYRRHKSTSKSPPRRYKDEKDNERYHHRRRHHSDKNKSSGDNDNDRSRPFRCTSAPNEQPPVPTVNSEATASKLLEAIQQRKQLFSNKTVGASTATKATTLWKQSTFSGDEDGKMSAKFRRLMGMKDGDLNTTSSVTGTAASTALSSATVAATATANELDTRINQQKYLADLEEQYEVARRVTHTQKGLGLGFGSSLL